MDNCGGDNKNHMVIGFLGHLVGYGVFEQMLVSPLFANMELFNVSVPHATWSLCHATALVGDNLYNAYFMHIELKPMQRSNTPLPHHARPCTSSSCNMRWRCTLHWLLVQYMIQPPCMKKKCNVRWRRIWHVPSFFHAHACKVRWRRKWHSLFGFGSHWHALLIYCNEPLKQVGKCNDADGDVRPWTHS